jgi:hypothetical protein
MRMLKTLPILPLLGGVVPTLSEMGVKSTTTALTADPATLLSRILHNPAERGMLMGATLKDTLIPGAIVYGGEPWESYQARSNPTLGDMRVQVSGGHTLACGDRAWCILTDTPNAPYEWQLCQIAGVYADEATGERLCSVYLLEKLTDELGASRFDAPPFFNNTSAFSHGYFLFVFAPHCRTFHCPVFAARAHFLFLRRRAL